MSYPIERWTIVQVTVDVYFEMDQIGKPGQVFGIGCTNDAPAGDDHEALLIVGGFFVPGEHIHWYTQQFL